MMLSSKETLKDFIFECAIKLFSQKWLLFGVVEVEQTYYTGLAMINTSMFAEVNKLVFFHSAQHSKMCCVKPQANPP